MLLIADSGSTKTSWRLIDNQNTVLAFHTEGLNPYYKTIDEIKSVLNHTLIPNLPCKTGDITQIYFYGAGCSVPAKCEEVKKALADSFPQATIEINHDILGAARACCGHEKGIACILGTGSNSCSYDGTNITETIGGLGYILGDEGSGFHIGKTIVAAYLNGEMPKELENNFSTAYNIDRAEIFKNVYATNGNRFLASFSLYAEKHKTHPFIKKTLQSCFYLFLDKHVCRYPNYTNLIVSFVGSVAYYNKDILVELCKNKGIKTGKFVLDPVEELAGYYEVN